MSKKFTKWQKALEDLHYIASKLGVEVIYDRIEGEGGFCTIHNKPLIVVNRIYSPQYQVAVFLKNLNLKYSLDDFYLSPLLRNLLENSRLSNAS